MMGNEHTARAKLLMKQAELPRLEQAYLAAKAGIAAIAKEVSARRRARAASEGEGDARGLCCRQAAVGSERARRPSVAACAGLRSTRTRALLPIQPLRRPPGLPNPPRLLPASASEPPPCLESAHLPRARAGGRGGGAGERAARQALGAARRGCGWRGRQRAVHGRIGGGGRRGAVLELEMVQSLGNYDYRSWEGGVWRSCWPGGERGWRAGRSPNVPLSAADEALRGRTCWAGRLRSVPGAALHQVRRAPEDHSSMYT